MVRPAQKSIRPFSVALMFANLVLPVTAAPAGDIIVGARASALEQYAAQELQRYLYQISGSWLEIKTNASKVQQAAFVVGQRHTNPLLKKFVAEGHVDISPKDPGPQGYVLKTLRPGGGPVIAIAGSDEAGCLYGVYGLLEDHYGIGFYLGGDVLPDQKTPLRWVEVNERKAPAASIRGLLPWTNFPQSPAVYSWEDWKFVLDQMAKMRFNFILIHNYNGEHGHNEMFHNFTLDGVTSRGWMPTARSGHGWRGAGWDVNEYLFGASDLFDDYDFGSDCALHNETLSNEQVFRKGVSLFQRVIAHAQARGIQVGLGLDIDMIPPDYKTKASDPKVIAARVEQIARDYPDLDWLFCFQSEYPDKKAEFQRVWREIFMGFYHGLKSRAPSLRLAASGWGLDPGVVADLPPDVICAPIAAYSAKFESGARYGRREYWGCPWLERDYKSSQYYYPYNVNLSDTIAAWRKRAPNMKGLFALTWRLTGALEPKLSWLSKAPWDTAGRLRSAKQVYRQYASLNYGPEGADEITGIINQNEPFACDFGECEGTPTFSPSPGQAAFGLFGRRTEFAKAQRQLGILDLWIDRTTSPARRERLRLLRGRIAAAGLHIELNERFEGYGWDDLPGGLESWVRSFTGGVTDISSLGNVVSVQNRYVRMQYLRKEEAFRNAQPVKAPSRVVARGTGQGAILTWSNEEPGARGFNVYRDGRRLNPAPLSSSARMYTDAADGNFRYTVTALSAAGLESAPSVPSTCAAGRADKEAPRIVVISLPTSAALGQSASIKARLLDNRGAASLSVTLVYRAPGAATWKKLPMPRRERAVFAARIPATDITPAGVEYFIEATDGDNPSRFPVCAPDVPCSLVACQSDDTAPPNHPAVLGVKDRELSWAAPADDAFWFCLYRSRLPDFEPAPANLLTFLAQETTSFKDGAPAFDGRPLKGGWHYRITAMDRTGNESPASPPVLIDFGE